MAKIVKIGWFDIPLKEITNVVIDGKTYFVEDFLMKGTFYKLIKNNIDEITYFESNDYDPRSHRMRRDKGKFKEDIKMILENSQPHSFKQAAVIIGDDKIYFINGFEVTHSNWLEHPEVQMAQRENKLKRIIQ